MGADRDAGVHEIDGVARAGVQQGPQRSGAIDVLDEIGRHGEALFRMEQGVAGLAVDDGEVDVLRWNCPVERVQANPGRRHRLARPAGIDTQHGLHVCAHDGIYAFKEVRNLHNGGGGVGRMRKGHQPL